MKKSTYLLLATLATLFSVHAHAEKLYTAGAFGSNGAYGWAADKTQKKANKTALDVWIAQGLSHNVIRAAHRG